MTKGSIHQEDMYCNPLHSFKIHVATTKRAKRKKNDQIEDLTNFSVSY